MSASPFQYDDANPSMFTKQSEPIACPGVHFEEDGSQIELTENHHISDVQEFDPKIREYLEELNRFSTRINQLEKCYEEENSRFHKVLNESSIKLGKLMKKCGERSVNESRPYYDALQKLKTLQIKCQIAAIKFEKYNELHTEAKQAISDAELMFHKEMRDDDQFDQFWQEKLNVANLKFTEAKIKLKQYEDEHMQVMEDFRVHECKISTLLKKHKNSIRRSKLYFDEANLFDSKLKAIKDDIHKLEEELLESKQLYSQTLKNLEGISEEIHERRAQIMAKSLKREPGVGAEIIEDHSTETTSNPYTETTENSCPISELNDKFKQL